MKFSVFQVSRRGGRKKNEDRMGYCYTREAGIFLLADGMGGHPQGELAAYMALQIIATQFQKEAQPTLADVRAFLESAVLTAHRHILHYASEKGMLDTPRTTLVLAVIQDGRLSWAHCGDSRLYLIRQGELMARTRDHSLLEQRQAAGEDALSVAPANRNLLFTCLGSPIDPVLDMAGPVLLQQGDKLMLCSDGLWSSLSDEDIVDMLANKAVSTAVPELVEQALRAGGPGSDNVTAMALEWETPAGADLAPDSISTETVSDGGFASTMQAGWSDAGADDLDDDAIERSIAEINEAIRRSAAKRAETH
jgi:PPM family protein phosphatase